MGKFFKWIGDLLKSCFDGIIGFFISIWDFFWIILCGIGQFFVDCWRYLWDWVIWAFYTSLDWILSQFVAILDKISDQIHFQIDQSSAQQVVNFISSLNAFFPLDMLFLCCSTYITVLIVWTIYKFVKSWIPTVSGT